MTQEPMLRKNDYIKYLRSLHGGKPIEDIPLNDLVEFRLVEDDGQSYWDWGEKITPKSACKMVYVQTRLMEFKDSAEYLTGKTRFVVPEEFVDDLERGRIHYITFTTDGNESKYTGLQFLTADEYERHIVNKHHGKPGYPGPADIKKYGIKPISSKDTRKVSRRLSPIR